MNCQYIITGISGDTFVQLHDKFMPRTIIMSDRWCVATQTFDIEINDKAMLNINNGDITIIFNSESFTIKHDDYIFIKCM